jgi:NAD(P)-dependent dehydrogenase (short-subunit alcohol dehydrogenase family)
MKTDMSKLTGKTALITGAANGIGRSTAILFAKEGAKVIIVDVDGDLAEATANSITTLGKEAIAFQANVMRMRDCKAMIDFAETTYGKLDILFNNAGIMHQNDADVVELDEKTWDMTMAINLKGVVWGCKYGIPALKRTGGGSIINMSSIKAFLGSASPKIAYTASKGAVMSITRDLAVQHAKDKIRVNALCPGPVQTKAFNSFIDNQQEQAKCRLNQIPLGRAATPEDIAKSALFLSSDDASYITGSAFIIDGGLTAAYFTSNELNL